MAEKPTAGTAINAPVISPLMSACRKRVTRAGLSGSGDLDQNDLPALDLLVAELRVADIAGLGEVARAAGAVIVDGLLGCDRLQAVNGIVDLGAARRLAGLADRVLDRRTGRIAGQRDR